jgi:hypothetical protein
MSPLPEHQEEKESSRNVSPCKLEIVSDRKKLNVKKTPAHNSKISDFFK